MKIIKNSEELAKLVNKHSDLILPNEDVRIEFEPTSEEIKNVECGDLYMGNDCEMFDFNGEDFNGGDFNGWDFNGGNFNGLDFNGGNFDGGNFNGEDFNGLNFDGGNFDGGNFDGLYFNGGDFNGGNFNGGNFDGLDFDGGDFNGWDFNGRDFNGKKISYHAAFVCYGSCTCTGWEARRENALPIQCLDGKLTIKKDNN